MTPAAQVHTPFSRQIEVIVKELSYRRLSLYLPALKQRAFHDAGGEEGNRERLLMAANQVGKTTSAAVETAYHLTGNYPDWWDGARFTEPTMGWAGNPTGQNLRDNVQRLLLGLPGEWGTGTIPKASIIRIVRNTHGVKDQVDTILVRHVSGGISRITLKSYDQGREKWQGPTLNFVWFDEEPPEDIYMEGLTRTNATMGLVYLTFTPLLGMSKVVYRFLMEKGEGADARSVIQMSLEDAPWYTPEQRKAIIAQYPAHERDARTKGIPTLGSGRVYPVAEEQLMVDAFKIPDHWPRIGGMDIGYDHPFAAVWVAWDRDSDTKYVYDAYRIRQATPTIHAVALKARGPWIPFAWPHDALQHDKGESCKQIAMQYRELGVKMLPDKATHAPAMGEVEGEGGFGLEAGVMELLADMEAGQFKVFKHLNEWFEEFRLYHRKDGKIVKEHDDLLSATLKARMMLRHAKLPPERKKPRMAGRRADPVMGRFGT